MLLNEKYKLLGDISRGNFGEILKVMYKDKNYALKMGAKDIIKYESTIYKELKGLNNISSIYDIFEYNDKMCFILDYYKMNLSQYKFQTYNTLNYIEKIEKYIKELIITVKHLHDRNIIHRDLKPSNICLSDNLKLFLIDFGIAKFYRINNIHNVEKKINALIGSINFSSLNVLNLIEPSRRDDIESIMYILIYMLLNTNKYIEYDNLNNLQKKDIVTIKSILQQNNENNGNEMINYTLFERLFTYIRRLKYNQQPDYEYILELIDKIFLQKIFLTK